MAEQQNHPKEIRIHHKGVNRDVEPEFLSPEEATDVDSFNMRSTSVDGKSGAKAKIKGEELLYPAIDNACFGGTGQPLPDGYKSIGAAHVNGRHIEFWADTLGVNPSFIRIDGKIVCRSERFPIRWDRPLQLAWDEDCPGGEVYITDYESEPMFFNVLDLMENGGMIGAQCTAKYFDNFNLSEHVLILRKPTDVPVFTGLTTDQGTSDHVFAPTSNQGMPVGYYTYAIRYVTQSGDATQWSQATPQIPVVLSQSPGCQPAFPGSRTYSGPSDFNSPSTLGVQLRIRIDNELGFDFVQVRRNRWNQEDALGVPAESEICGEFEVAPGERSIRTVLDLYGFIEALTDEEITDTMSAIRRAKAIRFFENKLYLMNVEYASRDIEGQLEFDGGAEPVIPVVRKMGKLGHTSPYNGTYYKHLQTQEKYGWAVVLWDNNGNYSFASPIPGAENLQQPSRRHAMSNDSQNLSYYGVVTAATVDGTVERVFEVFDLAEAVQKPAMSQNVNISDDAVYRPFRPTGHLDSGCTFVNVNPTIRNTNSQGDIAYQPKGFGPDYYAHGVAVKAVKNLPEWASAFSVVRTRRAQKVVAQGIAHYSLNSAGSGANTTKQTNRVWAYFPDADDNTGITPQLIEDIQANPSAYRIVASSPLGFFTEVHTFRNVLLSYDRCVDLITYARIIREEYVSVGVSSINAIDNLIGIQGPEPNPNSYVGYGIWRRGFASPQTQGPFQNGAGGDQEFTITNINDNPPLKGRGNYVEIQLGSNIYWHATADAQVNGDTEGVKNWHEPLYVINIIKVVADVPEANLQQYVNTGHYQKIRSVIGESDGTAGQSFETSSERWEDFTHYKQEIPPSIRSTSPYLIQTERFIYVMDEIGNERRWLNVNERSLSDIQAIIDDITNTGSHTVTDAWDSYEVFGVYRAEEFQQLNRPFFRIVFDEIVPGNLFAQVPQNGWQVIIKYDDRIPVRVFGGDTWINEAIWAPIDLRYGANGNPEDSTQEFRLNVGFPHRRYTLDNLIRIMDNASGAPLTRIQDEKDFRFSTQLQAQDARIRQMVNMFCCETRVNLSFFYNTETPKNSIDQAFPKVNYIMRPHRWDPTAQPQDFLSDNNIHSDYGVDYGDEWENWNYGGFRFLPQVNIDKSKENLDGRVITSRPAVGFIEKNLFCGRIHWSLTKDPGSIANSGIRTFPELNFYDLPTINGAIKLAYASLVDNMGFNLFAFTENGIAMLLVDKRFLSEATGQDLATITADNAGVVDHRWVSSEIGLSDEMWRSFAEFNNFCYFANKLGIFAMRNNQLVPILRLGYYSKVQPILDEFGPGYEDDMTAAFSVRHMEYMLTVKRRGNSTPINLVAQTGIYGLVDLVQTLPPQLYEGFTTVSDGPNRPQFVNVQTNISPVQQGGLLLGGSSGFALTVSVAICNNASSGHPLVVQFLNENGFWVSTLIQIGECILFIFGENERGNPFFTPRPLDPIPPFLADGNETFVFDTMNNVWQMSTAHTYDQYLRVDNRLLGMRHGKTYELDKGNILNDNLINASFIGVCIGTIGAAKEFIRIRVNSDNKPVRVRFYLNKEDAINDNFVCELTSAQLKDRRGFEHYIPRQIVNRLRVQGRILFFRIIHNLDEDFRVVTTEIQHKNLK